MENNKNGLDWTFRTFRTTKFKKKINWGQIQNIILIDKYGHFVAKSAHYCIWTDKLSSDLV